jgi:hypothetical protein
MHILCENLDFTGVFVFYRGIASFQVLPDRFPNVGQRLFLRPTL